MTAEPVGGYEANTYQIGPYTVKIGEYYGPERTTLSVHRAWWPLW